MALFLSSLLPLFRDLKAAASCESSLNIASSSKSLSC